VSGGDKISEALSAVSNPLSAAKSTVESARGLVKETYGLVEDVRDIAAKEKERREKISDERAVAGSKAKVRIAKRVGSREVQDAVQEHNAAVTTAMAAAKAAIIKQRQQEQEHALIWSMSQSERDAYYAEKQRQIDEAKKEKLRLIREADARKERNETILASVVAFICIIGIVWVFLLWMHHITGALPNVPGAEWVE
jgi:hypothetical protein